MLFRFACELEHDRGKGDAFVVCASVPVSAVRDLIHLGGVEKLMWFASMLPLVRIMIQTRGGARLFHQRLVRNKLRYIQIEVSNSPKEALWACDTKNKARKMPRHCPGMSAVSCSSSKRSLGYMRH